MSKILVTGATGQLGAAVTESLLKQTNAANVSILVRDAHKASAFKAKGVNVLIGDYNDYQSLVAAFQGIDKLYLVSGNDIANRTAQQGSVIKAAKEAGVKHIIYTSFQRKQEVKKSEIEMIATSHIQTEAHLKATGLIYTLLQHGLYADIIPMFAGEQLLETKSIYLPAGSGKASYALRSDLAEAGAIVLLDETGKYDNKEIELTGLTAVSWKDIASMLSTITGENITYTSPSGEEFTTVLTNAGVPAEYIGLFSAFSQAIGAGEFDEASSGLESILGRKPATLQSYLESVYAK